MLEFNVKIQCGNDVFYPDPRTQVAEILWNLLKEIEEHPRSETLILRDSTGNTVGTAAFNFDD